MWRKKECEHVVAVVVMLSDSDFCASRNDEEMACVHDVGTATETFADLLGSDFFVCIMAMETDDEAETDGDREGNEIFVYDPQGIADDDQRTWSAIV